MQGAELLTLLAQGMFLAAIPVSLVWALRGERRLAKLASVTAFLTFDLVVFGGFTRLTDSGLGCPDWPGCFAKANPLAAQGDIAAAALAAPGGPVDMTKAWIEMIHRSLAMAVGGLIMVLLVLCFRRRKQGAPFGLALGALLLVVVQGMFGALTVTMKLFPAIVTTHLLLALLLLALLTWLAAVMNPTGWLLSEPRRRDWRPGQGTLPAPSVVLARVGLLILVVQIALGGWVSTNYAVLACADFPTCHGQLLPQMDFTDAYAPLHPLGLTSAGTAMPIEALTAIHWTHRSMAIVVVLVLGSLAGLLFRTPLGRLARILAALIVLQAATGIANVIFGWPLLAAVLHNAGAAALCATLVLINFRLRPSPVPGPGGLFPPLRTIS
jgi:cytochrome c oxidase assembly protein subunit 15